MAKKLNKVEVVTVGVGWMGGIVAAELTKAGFNVVGLEKGDERTREDYLRTHDELRYTIRGEMESKLTKETYTFRKNLEEEAVPVRDKSNIRMGTGTGGGGSHWGAQTHRYYPYDFEIRSKTIERYGEEKIPQNMSIQDWGITYDELEPYYDKFEKMAGVSGEPDPNYPERSNPYPNPPLKKTEPMRMFHEAATKMGYKPFITPSGTVSQVYTNPDGEKLNACQYCAFCVYNGCEYGAKADPIVTVIPTAQKTGKFQLRNHARVVRVLHDGKKATGVVYVDTRTGEEFEQPADLVVLTSFVFNNVRLLLLSQIGKPYNPVTGDGVIGKNFTDHHVSGAVGAFFKDKKFNSYVTTGCLGETITDFTGDLFDHSKLDFLHGGQIEMRMSIYGNSPIMSNNVPMGTPSWGKEFKEKALYYHNRYLVLSTQKATLPYRDYYLDLDPTYKDDIGNPLLRITWDVSDNDKNLLKYVKGKMKEIATEMGADIIDEYPTQEHFAGVSSFEHNAGGAIMGADPKNSAVNKYLQMWEMENLFVCGSSAFPHFGVSNPTTTAAALTYHATEGMIKYLKDGGGLLVKGNKQKEYV
jgi:gluconate 2-dehydrogenase alpha chain